MSTTASHSSNLPDPVQLSAALHLILVGLVLGYVFFPRSSTSTIDLDVIVVDQPKLAPQADIDLTKPPPEQPPPPEPKSRKVFGANRKSLQAGEGAPAVETKLGNTVATVQDDEKLKDDDADSLPIPVEEYLISAPPQLLESFRPKYPPEARERNIEGAVRVEILIDRAGQVRDARVLKGLGFGTEEAALDAAKRLRFKPAEAAGQAVAVKIQFVINFELER